MVNTFLEFFCSNTTSINFRFNFQVLTYGIIGYPFIMPGPVGGDFYAEAAIANYTYIYMKSVENALLKKSISTFLNKSKEEPEPKVPAKEETPPEKEEEIVVETEVEEIEAEADNSTKTQEPEEVIKLNKTVPDENVFSTNYDNFFNKDINISSAADIIKNISSANLNDVLEKATKEFPGLILF